MQLAVSCRACLESVERAFIVAHRSLFSLIIKNFKASPQPSQKDERLYLLYGTAEPHGGCSLIQRRDSALKDSPNAMSIAVAKFARVQNWRSQKDSALDTEP